MPDKLYQECRTVISGCRAIFEDLRESGIEILPSIPKKSSVNISESREKQVVSASEDSSSSAESLIDIQQEFNNCQNCTLSKARTQVIIGTGNTNARLMLVGGAPDSDEDIQGAPFVGEAGSLLDRILLAMKLSREDVYITNLVKCRPPGDREPENEELKACEAILKRQLLAVAPEMILCLGDLAAQTLLKTEDSINKLRGRWQSYAGIPLMPTFHPASLLQNPAGKHQVWEDVKQVIHRLQD